MDESTALKVYEALARIIAQRSGAVVVKVDITKKPPLGCASQSHPKEV